MRERSDVVSSDASFSSLIALNRIEYDIILLMSE
jgi:hypothetical protein